MIQSLLIQVTFRGNTNLEGEMNWPHTPFVNKPSYQEQAFNKKMIQMVEDISNGTLKNVSILDLPAFGSTIPWLEKSHGRDSQWPQQMNFEIMKQFENTPLPMFEAYKVLIDDWKNYILKVYAKNPEARFTHAMKNNKFFNFTRHIQSDLKSFLKVTLGSQLNAAKEPLSVWKETAHKLFENLKDDEYVMQNGLYDELIIGCALRQNLLNRRRITNIRGSLFLTNLPYLLP